MLAYLVYCCAINHIRKFFTGIESNTQQQILLFTNKYIIVETFLSKRREYANLQTEAARSKFVLTLLKSAIRKNDDDDSLVRYRTNIILLNNINLYL